MAKFMLLLKADANSEAGKLPNASIFKLMGDYNTALVNAGVLISAEGLTSSVEGERIIFPSASVPSKTYIAKGPFKVEEVVCGYWMLNCKDMEEARAWAQKAPLAGGAVLEVRRVHCAEDFKDQIPPLEALEYEKQLREKITEK